MDETVPSSPSAATEVNMPSTATEVDITVDGRPSSMSVDFGEVETIPQPGLVVVFAEQWPSWSFALHGLGIKEFYTTVVWRSAAAREEFKATSIGHTLRCSRDVFAVLDEEYDGAKLRPLVFIQGRPDYVTSILD